MKCDVLLLAALSEERSPLLSILTELSGEPRKWTNKNYRYDLFNVNGLVVAMPTISGMGPLSSAITACKALEDVSPKFILLAGIAGCMFSSPKKGELPAEAMLGDIAVSEQIIDYEVQKIKDGMDAAAGEDIEYRSQSYQCAPALIRLIKSAPAGRWMDNMRIRRPDNIERAPRIHFGNVLSGSAVLASERRKHHLREKFPKTIAIEMEAAGIASVAHMVSKIDSASVLMVKSYTDWADGSKGDAWRDYCTEAAARYCGFLLQQVFPEYLGTLGHVSHRDEYCKGLDFGLQCLRGSQPFPEPSFDEAAQALTRQLSDEVLSLCDGNYSVDLGTSFQFLLRASPLFKSASKILATSLDTVSTFWVNSDNVREARQYLDTQHGNANVFRLFVFSNAETAHQYGKVLDAHVLQYHNVFVTSLDHYEALLKSTIAPYQHQHYLSRDFAVLKYPSSRDYFIELSHRHLRIDPVDLSTNFVYTRSLEEMFESLTKELHPGDMCQQRKILRWHVRHWKSPDWPLHLESLFKKSSEVVHVVGFDVPEQIYPQLRQKLADLKYQMLRMSPRDYQVLDIKLRRRVVYGPTEQPIDGDTKGRLHLTEIENMKYLLAMRFRSRRDLMEFYRDRDHSKFRREVYALVDSTIKQYLKEIEHTMTNRPDMVPLMHDLLEKSVAHQLFRLDFEDDELYPEITRSEPFKFPEATARI